MMKRLSTPILILVATAISAIVWIVTSTDEPDASRSSQPSPNLNALDLAELNYGERVRELAKEHDLPYEYLMSLIVLECSGIKPAGHRYEKGVYKKLVQVRDGDRRKFENIRQHHLEGASDEALRNLATSWGPFQLMGYKCIALGANVHDIRGDGATKWGVVWIEEEYGKVLRKGKFKDAFHIHNTGQKFPLNGKPKTHDPSYIDRGLRYIDHYREKETASR